ncbi:MAG TPA: type II toxin-antitoxin system VapC family toxin [Propionicimonas sp.]|nr:type II toxin-antitoxin system VapC family toxin [Propionicimonas sp.]HQA77967.1 type II toxin-antitoxin system VapC family toxin [Propionicimonas sp.]HQD95847.1 type II toxin-antitoxin system VapC family toxin [Propionicimonas sp.]
MTLVVDASVVVAALIDSGNAGAWADQVLIDEHLLAPDLLLVEVTNILRRLECSGQLPTPTASLAQQQLLALPVEAVPFAPCAERIWELRRNLTGYDAWYVAAAELASAPLATLDLRLASAAGIRCRVLSP